MAIGFAFDGGGAMTDQPARLAVSHRRAPEEVAANGGVIGVPWTNSRTITVTWKDNVSHGTLAALVSAFNADREHTIAFTDPGGTSYTIHVDWAYPPDFTIEPGYVFGEIVCEFNERPD